MLTLLVIMHTLQLQIGLANITPSSLQCVVHQMLPQNNSIPLMHLDITQVIGQGSIDLFLIHQKLCCMVSIPPPP